ncbi:MAG: hypothetical protein JXO22_18355 [Phycisphaerae bacterium]|nr:hypothetical protein [Phycisphaerae bacterium]
MKKLATFVAILAVAGVAYAGALNEDLNSTNGNVSFTGNTGFAVDNQLCVETVERLGDFSGWVWPAMTINFADTVIDAGAELDLLARYHQQTYTWDADGDPNTPDITREAYTDANVWLVLHGPDGDIDLAWADNDGWKHIGDVWLDVTKDLSAYAGMTVNALEIRSTNWDAPNPNCDFYHFANLTITPEPASILMLALGLLLRRR